MHIRTEQRNHKTEKSVQIYTYNEMDTDLFLAGVFEIQQMLETEFSEMK